MKKHLLLFLLLLGGTLGDAAAQVRPGAHKPVPAGTKPAPAGAKPAPAGVKPVSAGVHKPVPKTKGKAAETKGVVKPPPTYSPIVTQRASEEEAAPPPVFVNKLKLKKPVLVYYQEAAPGISVQQLIIAEEYLGLLKTLNLEQLMARREVFVDGLGNLTLPGSDVSKFRLLGTSAIAETTRRPAGDGRSFYSRLKVPSSGFLYVVRESAEEYRHFVKGPQQKGALLDFQVNGLPGVDSVRAVYTLRKMDSSERGAGSGETIR